jgi:hypothetical protein
MCVLLVYAVCLLDPPQIRSLLVASQPDPSMYGALPPGAWWEVANGRELPPLQPYADQAGPAAVQVRDTARVVLLSEVCVRVRACVRACVIAFNAQQAQYLQLLTEFGVLSRRDCHRMLAFAAFVMGHRAHARLHTHTTR